MTGLTGMTFTGLTGLTFTSNYIWEGTTLQKSSYKWSSMKY